MVGATAVEGNQPGVARVVTDPTAPVSRRILIVEDDTSTREVLAKFIKKEGHACATATDASDALQQMTSWQPDVVVSDVKMPGMDGLQLFGLIRQHFPTTSVIIMTGYGSVSDAVELMKRGASDYLLKPIHLPQLKAVIEDAIARKQAREKAGQNGAAHAARPELRSADHGVSLEEFANGLLTALRLRMDEGRSHALRVADLAHRLAEAMHLAPTSRQAIRVAALIHDVGKIGIDNAILSKPAAELTPEEELIFHTHPLLSARVVEAMPGLKQIAEAVRHHHERFDGEGYPDGLMGTAIPFGARIIAVANTYDRMVFGADAPACTPEQAIETIATESGKAFDFRVCPVLNQVVERTGEADSWLL